MNDAPARITNALHLPKIAHPPPTTAGIWPAAEACATTPLSNAAPAARHEGPDYYSGPFPFVAVTTIIASPSLSGQLCLQGGPNRFKQI